MIRAFSGQSVMGPPEVSVSCGSRSCPRRSSASPTAPLALVVFTLLWLAPVAEAQSRSGTSSAGLFFEVSGSGDPLVFIHAFSLDRRMWEPQIGAFENRHTVVRYDLRGHGRSAPPENPYTGFDELRGLLDDLNITKATLVGLSAGSELAINFAIAYPDRVARVVLAAPGLGGYATPPLTWMRPVFEAAGSGDARRAASLWARTPIMAVRSSPEAKELVTSMVMDNWRLWTYRRTERPLDPPAVGRLAEITCRVLVIVGDDDLPHILDVARVLVAGIPRATLVRIPRAGHMVNLEAPESFNQALARFLASP